MLEHNQHYSSLDQHHNSPTCSHVYTLSRMVYNKVPSVCSNSLKDLASYLWEFLCQSDAIHGPDASFNDRELTYDTGYILQPTNLVFKYWCSIHQILCSRSPRLNRFQLMIWLATLAFLEKISMVVLKTLALLYTTPINCSLDSLANKSFMLNEEDNMREEKIQSLIFFSCPPADSRI